MNPVPRLHRFAFAYGIAFAILYPIAVKLDQALFTVYPAIGVAIPGTHHSADVVAPAIAFINPAMYWYGWTATAALGALPLGLLAAFVSDRWLRSCSGWLWLAPTLGMAGCVYVTIPWFRM